MKRENSKRLYFLNENEFFILCTTVEQVKKVEIARNYHIDTTYKVMFPDFPLLMFGCSDANRKFHPIFLAIIYEEILNIKLNLTSLTADMAPQFESLIANKYSKTKRLHCWFHVKKYNDEKC